MPELAVVSGGGTGIGRAIAAGLVADGFDVLIVGRREAVLEQATRELNASTAASAGQVSWARADLTDPGDVGALVERVRTEHGSVTAIVNNAGGLTPTPDNGLAGVADEWLQAYRLNVVSAVLLTTGLLPLLPRPGGRIVIVGSTSSRTGGAAPAYGAAKAALNGWVLSLSAQHAGSGISANAVLPGYVPGTEFVTGAIPPEIHDRIVSRISAGRPGRPEDTAGLVRYLVSPEAGFLTGQTIEVHGGVVPANR